MGSANLLTRYPQNTVWYVEGYQNGKLASSGSAVAVWLKKKDDSRPGRIYLLTCAHVVRGPAAESMGAGLGPVLDEIKVWQPGTSYAACRLNASIAQEITPLANGTLSTENLTPANDWVLLEVENEALAKGVDHAYRWDDPGDGDFSIFGYPGGNKSFSGGVVMPVEAKDFELVTRHDQVLILRGSESRPGMSGGPLFNQTGGLIGIHRSKTDPTLQFQSLSATYIRRQLEDRGYITRTPEQESVSNLRDQVAEVGRGIPRPGKVRQLNQIRLELRKVLDRDPNHTEAKYLLDDVDRAIRYYRRLPWLAVMLISLLTAVIVGWIIIRQALYPQPLAEFHVQSFFAEWNTTSTETMQKRYLNKETWLCKPVPALLEGECEILRTTPEYYELLPGASDTDSKRIRVTRRPNSSKPSLAGSKLAFKGRITRIQDDIVFVEAENYKVLDPPPLQSVDIHDFFDFLDKNQDLDTLKQKYVNKFRLKGKLPLKKTGPVYYEFKPPRDNPGAARRILVEIPRGSHPFSPEQLLEFEGLIDDIEKTHITLKDATVQKVAH